MPGEDEHDICRRLESELCALREAVIANGLSAGEMVVTDGQSRLADGAPVRIASPSN